MSGGTILNQLVDWLGSMSVMELYPLLRALLQVHVCVHSCLRKKMQLPMIALCTHLSGTIVHATGGRNNMTRQYQIA